MNTTEHLKADLAGRIAKAMYMPAEDIVEDTPFSDFGLESVTLVRILEGIQSTYNCTITVAELLEHQTLRAAAAFISRRIDEQVGAGAGVDGGQP
ncbi:MAG TPA: acyl carrier protein [Candidatus Acidoferrum sp.]|jgi:acyl carrier protein|nr:acyl carrier protein [Candidatus Acidoferrum sp.]